ncbi:MAG: FlgD immunoglobulin-like domain containing protein [Candidatus Marinimicrobia bacterium]|nr:hypothetical protein [Candidatus Neomarinimicrobiota bacterium]MDP6457650.1 FlgD immunoglobulin-like domain containing protein [Candidatus Neomarinimicrobiota bacterium]MDP6593486.1 FlgD immunoglobulin-like domain containing protein [Candidatus Neomarinimicrobiota bacterium]MDP6837201.1 FlgD immunoglobulin-like domain containing protein [Candidatus Neomarinimicrobiota bacterium]
MRTVFRTAGLVTIMLAMILGTGVIAQGQGPGHGSGHGPGMTNGHGPGHGILRQLTEEQRDAIRQMVDQMRDDGATREEIHDAVVAQLGAWGYEVPDDFGKRRPFARIMRHLTEEQRTAIKALVEQMKGDGASREEIRDAVMAQLEEWGIELPGNGAISERERLRAKNHPNPFNPETSITYTLTAPATVDVRIYNMEGQLVQSYRMGYQNEGTHSLRWDGVMNDGQAAPSGVYIYRITAGDQSYSARMLLMK